MYKRQGVVCDGLGSALAAVFGVLPNTSFSQNVGLITMTKVVNKFAIAIGGGFLIACGLFPKLAAIISIMPDSVLGGAAVMMFSSIVVSGIQLVTKNPVTARSVTILSVALGLGYGLGANTTILQHMPEDVYKRQPVNRPQCVETTAMGAAYLAGLAVGYWSSKEDVIHNWAIDKTFAPSIDEASRTSRIAGWDKAVKYAYGWAKEE